MARVTLSFSRLLPRLSLSEEDESEGALLSGKGSTTWDVVRGPGGGVGVATDSSLSDEESLLSPLELELLLVVVGRRGNNTGGGGGCCDDDNSIGCCWDGATRICNKKAM